MAGEVIGDATELKWNERDLETCKHVVQTYCRSIRNVAVQAGGCYGVFAKYLSTEFTCVYTFEPSPTLFNMLVANVPELNVVKLQAALGYERKRLVHVECELPPGKMVLHPGMTRTVIAPGGYIPTMLIDDLGLEYCDLIYLDVEGDELFALQGARITLVLHKPVVVCEINSSIERRGHTRYEIFAFMREAGYSERESLRSDVVFVPGGT